MKKLLTKSILLAAALLVGSSAWADATPVYTKALSGWSSDDITSTEGTVDKWYHSGGAQSNANNSGLTAGTTSGLKICASASSAAGAQYISGVLTTSHTANSIVTLDAVWNVGTSSADGSNPYCTFSYGDLTIKQSVRSSGGDAGKTQITVNGSTLTKNNLIARGDDVTIHLKVNSSTREITEFSLYNGETKVADFSDLSDAQKTFAAGTVYNTVTVSANSPASSSQRTYCFVKSLTITEEVQALDVADVTLKYVDTAGNDLSSCRADETLTDVVVGTSISDLLTSAYTSTFYNGTSNKYVYANAYVVTGGFTEVQNDGNTVTLKFTDYPATAYTVKAQVSGADLTELASGTAYFDGSTTEYWKKYISIDGSWYETNTCGLDITSATNNVAFTAASIDYLFECEEMTVSREYNARINSTAYSNGIGVSLYAGANASTTSTVSAGVYNISLNAIKWADKYADNYLVLYSTDQTNWITLGTISYAANEEGVKTLAGAIIPSASYIQIRANDGSQTPRRNIDYITLTKTEDIPSNVSKSITSAGYATYCSPYALDFSAATPAGLKAYIATANDGSYVTLSEVASVPANTGVLLKGDAATYEIPVVAGSDTDVAANLFVGTTTGTTATAGSYVLYNGDAGVGFYKTSAASFTIGANTAYLPAAGGEANLRFIFDGEDATAINALNVAKAESGVLYNVAGQRVSDSYKGIVIKNGKKYLNK